MKIMKFVPLLFVMIISACDPCANLDCVSSNYVGQFRIVRSSDSADLVFGPAAIYDKNRIRFFSVNGTDTTNFEYRHEKFPDVGYDSILLVNFFPKKDVAYMRLSNGDIDTLQITYKESDTKCCGHITEITNFKFNNTINIPGGKGTQLIKK